MVPPDRDSNPGADIAVTAYRFGDTFSYCGRATKISNSVIVATVIGELQVGELVLPRYPIRSGTALETHCRVHHRQGNQYEFVLLSLNERQCRCLLEKGDGLLAAQLL